jgi:26S proteasome regulatory subunit N1
MTSVPKPLKYLREYYLDLTECYAALRNDKKAAALTEEMAALLSVLSMTCGDLLKDGEGEKDGKGGKGETSSSSSFSSLREATLKPLHVLRYRLDCASPTDNLVTWGGEYLRTLSGEISLCYNARLGLSAGDSVVDGVVDDSNADLLALVEAMTPAMLLDSSDSDAIDLLIETNHLPFLATLDYVDDTNVKRICDYIVKTSGFMLADEGKGMKVVARECYKKCGYFVDAVRVQLMLGYDKDVVEELLREAYKVNPVIAKQMCLVLGRARVNHETECGDDNDDDDTDYDGIIGNENLSEIYISLGRDLDVVDAKTPEDIYKSHLSETAGFKRGGGRSEVKVDSARGNLSSSFVNAFVNAGFNNDTLLTVPDSDWLYKNKSMGMLSATASIGMIMLWNVEVGINVIDKYLYSSDEHVKAGAALGVGIVCSGIRNEADPAFAYLQEHCEGKSGLVKLASLEGIGIAYAGTNREEIVDLLMTAMEESEDINEIGAAALSLGHVCVGTANSDASSAIVQKLMELNEEQLGHYMTKFMCLGLGLLYLGKGDDSEGMREAIKTVEHKISKLAVNTLDMCAFAGSGQVLKVQSMLHECSEHLTEDADHQAVAAVGIAMITMGEDVGREMAVRAMDHLLHYSELPIKRAVPLALALLHVSDPEYTIVDQLSRLSHDQDEQVSQNAIMGLGLISAGTNNSRVAGLLRGLSEFYAKEAGQMFCVRMAQGLLHMGKGLITLAPYHSDRQLMNGVGVAGILTFLYTCLDMKNTLLDKAHHLIFYLTGSMNPRMLVTVNPDLTLKPITVRVGSAVETVAQPGKPRAITGFQTHTSPVLLHTKERAEIGTEEFRAVTTGPLEGIVIVEENPDYELTEEEKAKLEKEKK